MFDILIKNGEVVDGSGKYRRARLDVAVEAGRIAKIAPDIKPKNAQKVIDAAGHIVVPGFIDIQNHSDAYWTIFDQPEALSLLSQGITTAVIGNCGSSLAPLSKPDTIQTIQKWHNLSGINIDWTTFTEFLNSLEGNIGVNVASLVGHATLRRGLLGDQVRAATGDEIKIMSSLLGKSIKQGAFGLSMGLVYAHEMSSSNEELLSLVSMLASLGGYLSVHLRSEGTHIQESLEEAITLAQTARVPLKISHFKIRKSHNWHLAQNLLTRIEKAYQKGLDISFDVYPYDTTWAVLYTYLPKWAYSGGRSEILKTITSPLERKKIIEFLKTQEHDYKKIIIAISDGNMGFVGKSIAQIAGNSGVSEHEALLNILTATKASAVAFDLNLSFEVVEEFMQSPMAMIATDGAGYGNSFGELVHPRCFGAMSKFLAWVRTSGKMPLEQAVRKITSDPARLLGLSDRGLLARNNIADITVFDPVKIQDAATYDNPFQISEGIRATIVDGYVAYEEKKVLGKFGSVLKKK